MNLISTKLRNLAHCMRKSNYPELLAQGDFKETLQLSRVSKTKTCTEEAAVYLKRKEHTSLGCGIFFVLHFLKTHRK